MPWLYFIVIYGGFPGGSDGKEYTCNAGDLVQFLGQEDSLEKGMATHSSSLASFLHGVRSLVGPSPWGCKELDTTEGLKKKKKKNWGCNPKDLVPQNLKTPEQEEALESTHSGCEGQVRKWLLGWFPLSVSSFVGDSASLLHWMPLENQGGCGPRMNLQRCIPSISWQPSRRSASGGPAEV